MDQADTHPATTMDDVRNRMGRIMDLLDRLASEPHEVSGTVAAQRSSAVNGGDMA